MQQFNVDLHIHSKHSIAVSQKLNLDTMNATAAMKGLHILSTGDITQPDWRAYLKENLKKIDGGYKYKDLWLVLGTELEDSDSIHHVVLLPDFQAASQLQNVLSPFVKNITGRWAGRPHVNKTPAEIVEIIEDVGGICGPAHAFTPFKSIFRQGKYRTLEDAYGTAAKKIAFLELGLSADTNLADRMECLQDVTFLSNSDAHSEGFQSLGREFNRMALESPTFDEIKKACLRRGSRKVSLNVGLDPRLGKYNIMFCSKCRRRVRIKLNNSKESYRNETSSESTKSNTASLSPFSKSWHLDGFSKDFIDYSIISQTERARFLQLVANLKFECPLCKKEIIEKDKQAVKKISRKTYPKIKLGVSERINEISTWESPHHPEHRPNYLDIIPLVEMLRKLYNVKSPSSKRVLNEYHRIIENFGTEFSILVDKPVTEIKKYSDGRLGLLIEAFRNQQIEFLPGGGGTFGEIKLPPI